MHTYRYLSSECGVPSITTLQKVSGIDARDFLSSSSAGVHRLAQYFDDNPSIPRRVVVKDDGVHVRQGVIWTKYNSFVGFVDQIDSIADYIADERALHDIEYASTAEVFLLSVVHSGTRQVVRVAPSSAAMRSLDYTDILDELLESLDCNNIVPVALCFDAATPVIKGLRSLIEGDERDVGASMAVVESLIDLGPEIASDASAHGAAPDPSDADSANIVQMFAIQQREPNRRACMMFGTTSVPAELIECIESAHARFPVYFRDPYSKKAVLLCGDSAHLLKRERNLLYYTRSCRRFLKVRDDGGLVRLNWPHIVSLRAEDRAAQRSGLPAQEPFLTDNFVNLSA